MNKMILSGLLVCAVCVQTGMCGSELHEAAEKGDLENVRAFLEKHPEQVNKEAQFSLATPLQIAAREGHADICGYLIEKGADVNIVHVSCGYSALHWAAFKRHSDVCSLLLGKGAHIDIHIEAALGYTEKIKKRLEKDAEAVNTKLHRKDRVLKWAVAGCQEEICRLLISKGAHVNSPDRKKESPALALAADRGYTKIAEILLDSGAEVNSGIASGRWTPLHRAAYKGHEDMCRLLIARGADVNASEHSKSTPLYLAAGGSAGVAVCRILVENGARVNAADKYGWTPLDKAEQHREKDVAEFLKKQGAVSGRRRKK